MPTSQAPRLYPEIFPQESIDWAKTQPIINREDIEQQDQAKDSGALFQDQHP